MGRTERRNIERAKRINNRKNKILLSKEEIGEIKKKTSDAVSEFNVEVLMTCIALAEHRLYGFGEKRILRTLHYMDDLMGGILDETATVDDYKKALEEETGIIIKC